MGSDRKDKKRALQWIESASHDWKYPQSVEEISDMLNANTQLMFGELVVEKLCRILVTAGKLKETGDGYITKERAVLNSVDEEIANLGVSTK